MAKTVRLRFKSDEGKKFSVSMGHPTPALEEEGGAELAQAAIDVVMREQALNKVILECEGVDIVERNVKKIL